MKILFAVVSIFAGFIQLNVAVRISEKKCGEYSTIPRAADPKIHGHVVWINIVTEQRSFTVIGTLINEMFVLNRATKTEGIILHRSQVIFPSGEEYDIVEKYIHPLFNVSLSHHHNLALLRMESETPLDSSHRPACLWTKKFFESADVELYRCTNRLCTDNQYSLVSHKFLTGRNCTWSNPRENTKLFCVVPLNAEQGDLLAILPFVGSPIQAYQPKSHLPENYFIFGVSSFGYLEMPMPAQNVGTKISDHLDWIESIIWPEHSLNTMPIIAPTCGYIKIYNKPYITFSAPTFHGEFPWHAAIYISQGRGGRNYICGGTLLNENTVLTAAHCLYDEKGKVSPHLLIVSLGSYDLRTSNLESRESYVDSAMPHKQFNREHLENDIAILKLRTIIDFSNFIQPICLSNDSKIFTNRVGVTSGWGVNEHNITANILTKASLPILTNSECRQIDRSVFPGLLSETKFCAGFGNGTSVCSGDSGSGLILQHDGRYFIRGLVSHGLNVHGRCDSTQPAIFTDVVKFYDWITDKLK